jgi:hypothetical protein
MLMGQASLSAPHARESLGFATDDAINMRSPSLKGGAFLLGKIMMLINGNDAGE